MAANEANQVQIKSFETAEGDSFGDLLSADRIETDRPLKIGLLWTGFFEFWAMYPEMKGQITADAKVVHDRLSSKHDIVQAELVDTYMAPDVKRRTQK